MSAVSIILLVLAGILGWGVCGVVNYVGFRRLFGNDAPPNSSDLIVMFGPIGTFMLLLMAAMMGFTKLCTNLGERILAARKAS
jgi:hypothetical protein